MLACVGERERERESGGKEQGGQQNDVRERGQKICDN